MLNPEMAISYNNRGNSYGNLDQLQKAVEDFDRAIRLDPRFALAYYNRALAYNFLGRDAAAKRDADRSADLVPDPFTPAQAIEESKTAQ
jgi:tetratricopeptide (TPR) repeat protein